MKSHKSAIITVLLSLEFMCQTGQTNDLNTRNKVSDRVDQAMNWFPGDTETLVVLKNPFQGKSFEKGNSTAKLCADLAKFFIPHNDGYGTKDLTGLEQIQKTNVSLTISAARSFQTSTDIGTAKYQGCSLFFFDEPEKSAEIFATAKPNSESIYVDLSTEILVFHRDLFRDQWAYLICSPKPGILVCATNKEFLHTFLSRMASPTMRVALPADLPEWHYVDTHAKAWAVRHYNLSKAHYDISSPVSTTQQPTSYTSDNRPLGVVFYSCGNNQSAEVLYLSNSVKWLEALQQQWIATNEQGLILDLKKEFKPRNSSIKLSTSSLEVKATMNSDLDVTNFGIMLLGSLGHVMNL
jgi:hypothetical protein